MGSDLGRRYVFDFNTLISAYLFPDSVPGRALAIVLNQHALLMSIEIASELTQVLRREKFDRYVSRRRREELLAGTIRGSDFIETHTSITTCRDPNDNKFLELAIDGNASAVVSGDADLLILHPYRGITILTPRDFLVHFAGTAS